MLSLVEAQDAEMSYPFGTEEEQMEGHELLLHHRRDLKDIANLAYAAHLDMSCAQAGGSSEARNMIAKAASGG